MTQLSKFYYINGITIGFMVAERIMINFSEIGCFCINIGDKVIMPYLLDSDKNKGYNYSNLQRK